MVYLLFVGPRKIPGAPKGDRAVYFWGGNSKGFEDSKKADQEYEERLKERKGYLGLFDNCVNQLVHQWYQHDAEMHLVRPILEDFADASDPEDNGTVCPDSTLVVIPALRPKGSGKKTGAVKSSVVEVVVVQAAKGLISAEEERGSGSAGRHSSDYNDDLRLAIRNSLATDEDENNSGLMFSDDVESALETSLAYETKRSFGTRSTVVNSSSSSSSSDSPAFTDGAQLMGLKLIPKEQKTKGFQGKGDIGGMFTPMITAGAGVSKSLVLYSYHKTSCEVYLMFMFVYFYYL
jgi:hypothetical protein